MSKCKIYKQNKEKHSQSKNVRTYIDDTYCYRKKCLKKNTCRISKKMLYDKGKKDRKIRKNKRGIFPHVEQSVYDTDTEEEFDRYDEITLCEKTRHPCGRYEEECFCGICEPWCSDIVHIYNEGIPILYNPSYISCVLPDLPERKSYEDDMKQEDYILRTYTSFYEDTEEGIEEEIEEDTEEETIYSHKARTGG